MRGLLAVAVGRRGGEATARRLSPQRRKEIAAWARWNRQQRESGQLSDADFIEKLIRELRAIDPDLACFVKKASSMPFKFKDRLFQVLTTGESEVIRQAQEALCK